MAEKYERPDPDVLLARIKAQEEPRRGRLRIWLGSAPGVGTTYSMLQEGHRRKSRGTDVVIGIVESHGRPQIEALIGDLEVIPAREIRVGGTFLLEMDTDAVLARGPAVALVDELAHINAPGPKFEKRYEDVGVLLDAGITVISTLQVQNIESVSGAAGQITGMTVAETVPDRVVEAADQIELIDLPPEDLIGRLRDGCLCSPDQQAVLETVFTVSNLNALRDLALRATARTVEEKLDSYHRHLAVAGAQPLGERIMVAVDHQPAGAYVVQRARRMAAALKGEFVAVHVEPAEKRRLSHHDADKDRLSANLQLAEDLGAEIVQLRGDVAEGLIRYARANHVTQLFVGYPRHGRWGELLHGSVTRDILRKAPELNVHVTGDRSRAEASAMY
jgi:two-component system sensor histidine kinase KdpD